MKSFVDIFKQLCASTDLDIQFRALYVIRNIMKVNKQLALRIVETELMDVLLAIKQIKDPKLINERVNSKRIRNEKEKCLFILESKVDFEYYSNLFEISTYSTE